MSSSLADRQYMERALRLAARGRGRVEPNPMVGCVIVKAGRIIGEGYHRRYGGPHAEVDALGRCSTSPEDATFYVTLEPCCHQGKTPPCADAIIAARPARVVVGMPDPFEQVNGRGLAALKQAGIAVDVGICRDEAEVLNAPYLKLVRTGGPFVTLKWAQTLDGKIASSTGDSKWISSEPARQWVHRLRARVDAVLVGIGTVLADDPLLTARGVRSLRPSDRATLRLVLDAHLRTPSHCQLVDTVRQSPVIIVAGQACHAAEAEAKRRQLETAGCEVWALPTRGDRVDLDALLVELGRRQVTNLLVEGGAQVITSFLDAGLADHVCVFVAPKLLGGAAAPTAYSGTGQARLADALQLLRVRHRSFPPDLLIEGDMPPRGSGHRA